MKIDRETNDILGSLRGVAGSLALLHVFLNGKNDELSPEIMIDFIWGLFLQVDHTADRLEKYIMDLPDMDEQTIFWI